MNNYWYYGLYYYYGYEGIQKSNELAFKYFQFAITNGHKMTIKQEEIYNKCLQIEMKNYWYCGWCYYYGYEGFQKSEILAFKYFQLAITNGHKMTKEQKEIYNKCLFLFKKDFKNLIF